MRFIILLIVPLLFLWLISLREVRLKIGDYYFNRGNFDQAVNSHQRLIQEHISFLKRLIPYVNERGLELMLETNLDPFDSVETFLQIVDAVPGLKVQLDIGHAHIGHKRDHLELIEAFFQKFGSKIVYLHISDNDAYSDQHLPIGCGSIRWPEVVRTLKKYQYNNGMTLEVYRVDMEYFLMSKQKIETLWDNL
jgi:sugar phosphate isomerase/epimerase